MQAGRSSEGATRSMRVTAAATMRWRMPTDFGRRIRQAIGHATGLMLVTLCTVAWAQSPVGAWRSIDDKTGKPRAEIRIGEVDGKLVGRIERSAAADASKEPARCVKCPGDRADQPLIGMEIIRGVDTTATDGWFEGGEILDPDSGKVYRLRLKPEDGKLLVRGMIGPFYRTQTWERLPR